MFKQFLSHHGVNKKFAIVRRQSDGDHYYEPVHCEWLPKRVIKNIADYYHYSQREATHIAKLLNKQTVHKVEIEQLKYE